MIETSADEWEFFSEGAKNIIFVSRQKEFAGKVIRVDKDLFRFCHSNTLSEPQLKIFHRNFIYSKNVQLLFSYIYENCFR